MDAFTTIFTYLSSATTDSQSASSPSSMNDDLPQIDTVDYDKSSGSSGGCVVA
jgi:hypothetical protein